MCCDPYVSSIVAGALILTQCAEGFSLNMYILTKLVDTTNSSDLYSNIIKSLGLNQLMTIYAISVLCLLLYCAWVILTVIMLLGNAKKNYWLMVPGVVFTAVMLCVQTVLGAYFFAIYAQVSRFALKDDQVLPAYFLLAVIFSGWCFAWPTTNLVLFVLMNGRIKYLKEHITSSTPYSDIIRSIERDIGAPPAYSTVNPSLPSRPSAEHVTARPIAEQVTARPIAEQETTDRVSSDRPEISGWSYTNLLNVDLLSAAHQEAEEEQPANQNS